MKIISLIFIGVLIFSIFLDGCRSDDVTGASTLEANETSEDSAEESEEDLDEGGVVMNFKGKEGDSFLNNVVN